MKTAHIFISLNPRRAVFTNSTLPYVAPFIITTNPISAAGNTASVFNPVKTCPVVRVPTTPVVQNNANNLGQLILSQPQRNISSLSNPNPSFNRYVVQFGNDVRYSQYSVTQQPLQTVSTPVSSAFQVLQSRAGYSRHNFSNKCGECCPTCCSSNGA